MQGTSGAQRIPNPQAAIVESQNAQRIARRRAAATLAASVAQTGRVGLRRGPKRTVGGRFETIQKVPKPRRVKQQAFGQKDIDRFLSAFRFDPSTQVLAESRSGQILPRNRLAAGAETELIRASRRRTSTVIQPGFVGSFGTGGTTQRTAASFNTGRGLFGGIIVSPF